MCVVELLTERASAGLSVLELRLQPLLFLHEAIVERVRDSGRASHQHSECRRRRYPARPTSNLLLRNLLFACEREARAIHLFYLALLFS